MLINWPWLKRFNNVFGTCAIWMFFLGKMDVSSYVLKCCHTFLGGRIYNYF